MKAAPILVAVAASAFGMAGHADELFTTNGSRLVGELIRTEDQSVTFKTPYAGSIKINLANVERIVTEETVVIMMEDGTIYRDRRIDATEEALVATVEGQEPAVFSPADIKLINPEPWRLGEGYKWTGDIQLALESERGNSDTDEIDIVARTTWRSLRDRYQIDGDLERDETEGTKTKDKWKVRGKYERFFKGNPDNYWGGKLWFEYDRFIDLDLRTTAGPHIGRKFFDTKLLEMHAELGPVWVDERHDVAEDNDYPGALWEFEAESGIIGFGTTVYVIHDGILNFDGTDALILNTRIGIRLPLIYGFQTGFEAKYEYDGGVEDDVDDLDETYYFTLGYAW